MCGHDYDDLGRIEEPTGNTVTVIKTNGQEEVYENVTSFKSTDTAYVIRCPAGGAIIPHTDVRQINTENLAQINQLLNSLKEI